MFEASLVESSPFRQPRNRWPALISFAVQAIILSALVAIPLLHPEVIPLTAARLQLVAPRFTPPPPPPPVHPVRIQMATASTSPSAPAQAPQLPSQAFQTDAHPSDAPALAVGLDMGSNTASPLASLTGTASIGSHVTVGVAGPPAVTPAAGLLHISQGVTAGLLIDPIRPVYPTIARISHTQGTVVVQAIISKTGHIDSAHIVSGPLVLQAAALQAVRDARYRPFLLNNQPTEVETTISIHFRLGSD
jgi:protein TonB